MSNFVNQKIKLAINEANKILKEQKIVKYPVNIKNVAKLLGIKIKKMKFSKDEISGAIIIKGKSGSPIIAVNEDHCEHRQRFTIAHEIGHFMLHNISNMHVDSNDVYFRDANATSNTGNVKEIQANQFAAELLMPRESMTKDLTGRYKLKNDDKDIKTIADLAKKYNVSQQAMMIRVGSLII